MRSLALALVLTALTGCATASQSSFLPNGGTLFTLQVNNRSGGSLSVYANGRRIGTVSGSDACIKVEQSDIGTAGQVGIALRAPAENPFYLPPIDAYTSKGWEVDVDIWPNTRSIQKLSLRPTERCET